MDFSAETDVYKNNNKLTYRLTLLIVLVAGTLLLLLLDRAYRAGVVDESRRKQNEAASFMQNHLAVTLHNLTLVASDLHSFLLTQPEPPNQQDFADFSATLRNHYPAIDSLVFVGPDRVIRDIYPRVGNERAIGLDLTKRPAAPYIEKAIRERRFIVDPPHTMSNGRLAVIARSPIFRGERLVGLAQAILYVPDVVRLELNDLGRNFAIQLRDQSGTQFWGEETLAGETVSRDVVVGDGTWTLSIASRNPPPISGTGLALIWGVGGLMMLYTFVGIRRDHRLRMVLNSEVEKATRTIRLRNEELEEQILQRLIAEEKVRRSEQGLREAQHIAKLGNWEWDLVENKIYWSDEMYRIFGLAPQEIEPTYEEFHARIHPDDSKVLQQELPEVLSSGKTYSPEYRIILPDGTIRYVRMEGITQLTPDGKPWRVIGTVQDITQQKHAMMALTESEHKYRALMENASDGIVIASLEGQVLDVNLHIQKLLGYTREELLSLHVSRIHPPSEADRLRIAFDTMREFGFSMFEHRVLCKDGTTIPMEVAGTVITIGEQPVALGVFRDIRERKRIEEELFQHRYHLELLVEQRTAELVALNNELESFSYSVSHDLRAPLRAIHGFSAALKEDYFMQLDPMGCDYLERIHTAAVRMGYLIDDMLHLSRTIRAEMHWQEVFLSTIVMEHLLELNVAEPEREVHLVVAKNISALGDPTLLRSLMQNLLSNAWKFTRGRANAEIEFDVVDREGNRVYFVRDNGIGFDMNHAREIFKPFYRLHGVSEYEGSGIGLATVQRIVHRHGGMIWAESEPGRGATFYFTLGEGSSGCEAQEV